jgi:hypothetical protein
LPWLGGCSSDDTTDSTKPPAASAATTAASAGAAPTVCATSDAGDRRVVTIDVDDESDGSGRFGLKTPSPLPAGSIRLLLNAVEGNGGPVNVSVTSAGASVFDFVEVAPGVQCGADLDLQPGEYTVTFGAKTKTFTVDPAS